VLGAGGCAAPAGTVRLAGGHLRAGAGDWEAAGRTPPHDADVAPFAIDRFEATERDWAACSLAGACPAVALRGEPGLPVAGVTRDEAARYCAFRGGRLPAEDEWTWAAGGAATRRYPWGDTGAVCRRAAWGLRDGPCAIGGAGPELAGSHPDGATPDGVHDLAGSVAEWTAGDDPRLGFVRGGAWADALATDLRTWQRRAVSPDARSAEVGVRCVYAP
jgi:formylglycine-generating enzyme required for sulfatase activity